MWRPHRRGRGRKMHQIWNFWTNSIYFVDKEGWGGQEIHKFCGRLDVIYGSPLTQLIQRRRDTTQLINIIFFAHSVKAAGLLASTVNPSSATTPKGSSWRRWHSLFSDRWGWRNIHTLLGKKKLWMRVKHKNNSQRGPYAYAPQKWYDVCRISYQLQRPECPLCQFCFLQCVNDPSC